MRLTARRCRVAVWLLAAALAVAIAAPAGAAVPQISTVAGTGASGFSGDGGPATAARLSGPVGVTVMPDGGYLIVDQANQRIRRVAANGTITTVAGNGTAGFAGDGHAAVDGSMLYANGVAVADDGSILIADSANNRIRRVRPDGTIETVAGTGAAGYDGDGHDAVSTALSFPMGVVALPGGAFVFTDNDNARVRMVDAAGIITTIASAAGPAGIARYPDGTLLVAEMDAHRVLRIPASGSPTVVAGTGAAGSAGDGGLATAAQLWSPDGVAIMPDGGFVIADSGNHEVRRVDAAGKISTIAGDGTSGTGGDGGPATSAQLTRPFGVAVTAAGDVLVADVDSHRIRRIGLSGGTPSPIAITGPTQVPRFHVGQFRVSNVATDKSIKLSFANDFLNCLPQQTAISARFPLPGTFKIDVAQVILGATTTGSTTITVPGKTPPIGAKAVLEPLVTCSLPDGQGIDITDGGPRAACSTSVAVGIAAAIGCFTMADKTSDLTAPEQAIVFRLYQQFAKLPWFSQYLAERSAAPCRRVVLVTCAPDYITDSVGMLVSHETVRIDGLDVTPARGSSVVVSRVLSRVVCAQCRVVAGKTVLATGAPINWNLDASPNAVRGYQPLDEFKPVSGLPTVGGLKPPPGSLAKVEIALLSGGAQVSRVTFPLQLPSFFVGPAGSPSASFTGENVHGFPDLSAAAARGPGRAPAGGGQRQHFTLPSVSLIGDLALQDVAADYDPAIDEWRFQGSMLIAGNGVEMVPTQSFPDDGVVLGSDGSFRAAGGRAVFDPPVPLAGPLALKRVGVSIRVSPYTVFEGSMEVSFADIAYANGTVVAAFPTDTPYVFPADGSWGAAAGQQFWWPVFGVSAGVGLDLPVVGRTELGRGWFVFSIADSGVWADVGGRVRFSVGDVLALQGSAEGTFNTASGNFMITGKASASVLDYDIASVLVRISNRGFVVCGHVDLYVSSIDPGVAVTDDGVTVFWGVFGDECDPNIVNVDLSPPRAATGLREAAPLVIDLPAGVRARTITLHGATGAPQVVVTGPGGETIRSGGTKDSRHLHVFSSADLKMTSVGIVGGDAGRYTISLLPGSSAVSTASRSDAPDPLELAASTAAPGPATKAARKAPAGTRTLRWSVNRRARQTIRFVERGAGIEHVLLTTSRAQGSLRYTPAVGATRARRVEAEVFLAGLPAGKPHVISRYLAPRPTRPAKATRVHASWKRRRLVVTWKPAANATGYRIDVTTPTGARIHAQAKGKARSITLAGVPVTSAGTVRVTTLGVLHRHARPAVVRYARLVAPRQGALPWSELRTGR